MRNILAFFPEELLSMPYHVQEKAKLTAILQIAGIILLPALGVVLFVLDEIQIVSIIALFSLVAMYIVGIVLLRKGRFQASANLGILSAAVVIIVFSMEEVISGNNLADITNNFYMFAVIFAATLLCRTGMTVGLVIVFLGYRAFSLYILSEMHLKRPVMNLIERSFGELLFSLIFSVLASYFIIRIFKKSIDEVENECEKNRSLYHKIKELFISLKEISYEMAVTSDELSRAMVSIDEASQTQAASTEQITATLEQIMSSAENISHRSEFQNEILDNLAGDIEMLSRGTGIINRDLQESSEFSSTILSNADSNMARLKQMHEVMESVIRSSSDMDKILGIIDDISEHIHLLSINASIEAAHAGGIGRGFAVVAGEVSKLSDQTAAGLKNINMLIQQNKNEVSEGTRYIKESIESINGIIGMVKNMGSRIGNINLFMKQQLEVNNKVNNETGSMQRVSDEIAIATREQRIATSESVNSLENISVMIQKNAAVTSNLSKNSERIAGMASLIEEKIGGY